MDVRLFALALPLVAAGCATGDLSSPSLASRPAEKLSFAEPEVTPAIARADPALDMRVAELRTRLRTVATGFDRAAAAAARAGRAPRAGTVGSDAWLDAQSALAELDDWRAQTTALGGEVDALVVERAATLAPAYPALTDAAAAVRTEVERQQGEADRLGARVPSG